MIFLWFFTITACSIAMFFNGSITFLIAEWEIDHSSPLDLCHTLNKFVQRVRLGQAALALLSVLQLWAEKLIVVPIVVICVVLFVFVYPKKNGRNGRYFDPSTMVRESNGLKIAHGCGALANFLILLYSVFFVTRAIVRAH
jgi:hypothetical protein